MADARLREREGTPRAWTWLGVASLSTALVSAGGLFLIRPGERASTTDAIPPAPAVSPATSWSPSEVVTIPSTAPSESETTATAPSSAPLQAVVASVSYTDDLPMAPLLPLGDVTVEGGAEHWLAAAVGDLGVVVRNGDEPNVHVLGFDGQRRDVPVTEELGAIAYGPGDMLYGLRWAEPPEGQAASGVSTVAIPLSGADTGLIVAEAPATGGAVGWVETSPSPLAHGRTGIVDRERQVGLELLRYVDVDELTGAVAEQPYMDDAAIVTASRRFVLQIEREPGWTAPFTPPIPAVGADSTVVYPTTLGAPTEPGDFPDGTKPALMVAADSGEVTWYSVPDGWAYASSDIWGTVFVRRDGDRLEIALLDDPTDKVPPSTAPPTVAATTVPPVATVPPVVDLAEALAGMAWDGSGISRTCGEVWWEQQQVNRLRCTELAVDPQGVPVSYDPVWRVVARERREGDQPVAFMLPAEYIDPTLLAAGPDDVVYFALDNEWPEASDVVAFSLAPDDTGREIRRFPEALGVGDADVLPTPTGLVASGWYDQGPRPSAEAAPRVPWVSRAGTEAPEIPFGAFDEAQHIVQAQGWQWDVSDRQVISEQPGRSWVVPTFDGGFIAAYSESTGDLRGELIRGWRDGAVEYVELPVSWTVLGEMILEPQGTVLIPDGDRFLRVAPFASRFTGWDSGLQIDVDAGTANAVGLNEYLDTLDWPETGQSHLWPWGVSAVTFADAAAGRLGWATELRTVHVSSSERGIDAPTVTVTTEGYYHDSLYGARLVMHLSNSGSGFRIESVEWSQACQPDRGHQDYQAAPCFPSEFDHNC